MYIYTKCTLTQYVHVSIWAAMELRTSDNTVDYNPQSITPELIMLFDSYVSETRQQQR